MTPTETRPPSPAKRKRSAVLDSPTCSNKNIGDICPYCAGDLSDLSEHGRENHIDWCAIKHIPDREIKH